MSVTSSGLNPCFLWDNSGYMLGFKPDDPKPERTLMTFEAFRSKHLDLEAQIGSPVFSAVCRFLEGWDPVRATEHSILAEVAPGFRVAAKAEDDVVEAIERADHPFYLGVHYLSRYLQIDPLADHKGDKLSPGQEKE